MRGEVLLLPTWRRNAHLWCALKRIRAQDAKLKIFVFSDRGEDNHELRQIVKTFNAHLKVMPVHDYYGNSYCVMEAFRWAYEHGYELVHVSEDDVMQKPGCLDWHREQHQTWDDIFASCGWIFNLYAPITDDLLFVNWFYSPNACFKREKLAQVVKHANPLYYNDMRGYILKTFPSSILHAQGKNIETNFYEQDAVVQFCLMEDKSQVVWNSIAKVEHIGMFGYNKPNGPKFEGTLEERIAQIEELISDPYWRASYFGRAVVEREIGHVLIPRSMKYRVKLPGGWQSTFESELSLKRLPNRVNSVPITEGAVFESI